LFKGVVAEDIGGKISEETTSKLELFTLYVHTVVEGGVTPSTNEMQGSIGWSMDMI